MPVVASRTAVLYQTVLRAQTSTPKSQPKVIRDLKLDFQITLDPDPDVCHLPDRQGISHCLESGHLVYNLVCHKASSDRLFDYFFKF